MDEAMTTRVTDMLRSTETFEALTPEQRRGIKPPTFKAVVVTALKACSPGPTSREQMRIIAVRLGQNHRNGSALTEAIHWLERAGVAVPDLLGWRLTEAGAALVTGYGVKLEPWQQQREQRPRQPWVEPERVEQPRDPEADYRTKRELLDPLSSDKVRFYMEKEGASESTIRAGADILTARGEAVPVIVGQAAAALEPTFEQRVQHAVKQMEAWSDHLFTQDDVTMLGGDAASKPHNIEALARERERRGVQVTTAPPVVPVTPRSAVAEIFGDPRYVGTVLVPDGMERATVMQIGALTGQEFIDYYRAAQDIGDEDAMDVCRQYAEKRGVALDDEAGEPLEPGADEYSEDSDEPVDEENES